MVITLAEEICNLAFTSFYTQLESDIAPPNFEILLMFWSKKNSMFLKMMEDTCIEMRNYTQYSGSLTEYNSVLYIMNKTLLEISKFLYSIPTKFIFNLMSTQVIVEEIRNRSKD